MLNANDKSFKSKQSHKDKAKGKIINNTENDGVVTIKDVAARGTTNWTKGIRIGELEIRQVGGF